MKGGAAAPKEEREMEEELGTEYLVKPVGRAEDEEDASDFEPGDETDEDEDIDEDNNQGFGGGGVLSRMVRRPREKDHPRMIQMMTMTMTRGHRSDSGGINLFPS
ncbi:hypothetical protein C4D60_Mb05t28890 [Musa balbisiana]|uniref:Uncharacterized protein n=1 Tax=Musa balbisiana TaxID=52838 RepID=A0A4S8JZR9_MUSBA|nr:hypothetical protein C4D60_Mb05t28890 [Musa balbisiana]